MRRYGLLGRTLKHSFSKGWFSQKFEAEDLSDCVYENFELPSIHALPALVQSLPDLCGLNVTIPYKEEVLPYLAQKNDIVAEVGACNCILVKDGELIGYNTDVIGFRNALQPLLKVHHKQALVLGTGGAAKAVHFALRYLGIEPVYVSRREGKGVLQYEDLDESVIAAHSLIVNTTPLGMFPNVDEAPPIDYKFITPDHLLFDLTYNPAQTRFLAEGARRGAATENGYNMLVYQAEESWRIWS